MALKKKAVVELEILDLAFGGKGIAKPEGFPVFVDRALPGDRIRARITRKKKSYAEAKLLEIVSPSHIRQTPPCIYAGYCGGCRWQALPYEKQLEYKQRHVAESLAHIGGLKQVPVSPVIPSQQIFGYRNKMEFSCTDRRWLTPEELENPEIKKGFGLGLHVPGTFDHVIDIEHCLLQPDVGNRILADIRRYILSSGLPAYGLKTHQGFWRFVMLRSTAAQGHWMVNIVTRESADDVLMPLARELMETYPAITSVINNVTARKAGVAMGESETVLAGDRCITETLGDFRFEISANSFFQTNTRGAESLYSVVSDFAELTGGEHVVDLYSGTGTIPIRLSGRAGQVTGIEIVESAVADAHRNAELNGIDNCRFLTGDIKDVLPGMDYPCDVMIIDPPRVGMHKDVTARVLEMAPRRLVYVSCNPATLARDLSLLKSAYTVETVQPVDMFPHTFHIESVARLKTH